MANPRPPLRRVDWNDVREGRRSAKDFDLEVLRHMDEGGACVVLHAITPTEVADIVREMQPWIDACNTGRSNFSGKHTKRVGALAARSPASHKALAHPVVLGACDHILGEQRLKGNGVHFHFDAAGEAVKPREEDERLKRYPWQLHLTQIIDIGPTEPPQSVHRDKWAFLHDFKGVEVEVSTMWALCEEGFTEENGATRVVPGSHRIDERELREPFRFEDTVGAVMPQGSVVIYTGSTFHGGGPNRSGKRRMGLNVDYNLGFLRQEENQYLSCPPGVAKTLPKQIQDLIGYRHGGGALGYVADALSPKATFQDNFDIMVPGMNGQRARL